MKKLYLFYPLLLIVSVLLIDKIFTISLFKEKFLQTGNGIYYKHREILYHRLLNRKEDNKKLILAMGDSRAYSFSNLAFTNDKNKRGRENKYDIYNFSGPQAVPAYSLYLLEKMVASKIKIDHIFLVLSPEGFDDSKRLMHKPFLRMGADDEFVKNHKDLIPEEDLEEYYLDQVFAFRKLEFDFKLFLSRYRNKALDQYNPLFNKELLILNLNQGEQLAYTTSVNDVNQLKLDSVRMGNIYFYNYKINDTQFKVLEEILKICKTNNIKIDLLWMKVFPDYSKNFLKYNLYELWWPRIESLANSYNNKTYDFNKIGQCELYYDASHQSSLCYFEYIHFLIDEIEGDNTKNK